MRRLLILGMSALLATGAASCKKSDKTTATTIDSLDIHQTGGIAGVNNHFRIAPAITRKGRTVNSTVVYDSVLPASKHTEVKGLLNTIPPDMVSNNQPAVQNGADMMYLGIVSYKAGTAYTYYINPEKGNSVYVADLNSALVTLTTP